MRPNPSVALTRSRPLGVARRFPQGKLQFLDVGEDAAGVLEIELAFVGETDPPCAAVEQAHAEALLELREALAYRRRREVEFARGGGE